MPAVLSVAALACGSRGALDYGDGAAGMDPPGGNDGLGRGDGSAFATVEETIAFPEPRAAPAPRLWSFDFDASGDCELSPPSLDAVLARALADVSSRPEADRRFLRYVSAGWLVPGSCDPAAASDLVADALPLLLNSLSLRESAARAVAVDGDALLFRIDLRETGWERRVATGDREHSDGWQAVVSRAALATELVGPEADALAAATGSAVPWLLAHDLAQAGLSANVYYGLLDAPASLSALKATLGIVPEQERDPLAYWRATTTSSIVSWQDRVLLRYRGPVDGPIYWQTLDRGPDALEAEAFLDPLALSAEESSTLYTLPNGLPAYFLSDERGNRRGQSSVLFDIAEDDFVPRTAPSCVRCHSEGTHPVVDALRPYLAADPNARFASDELELLAQVYPPQSELDELTRADTRRLLDAQARVGVPGTELGSTGGVVLSDLHGVFGRDLSPARAAGELFVSKRELDARRGELPGALRVLSSVGSLGRSSFNGVYRDALCVLHGASRNRPRDCP